MSIYVKVCGVTETGNTRMVAAAGVDAIGLNFYPKSKRFVQTETAVELRRGIPAGIDVVGVFVNSSVEDVVHTARSVGLTAIQFHGDESASSISEAMSQLPDLKMYRAFRLSQDNLQDAIQHVTELTSLNVTPHCVLVDAFVPGEYGGTGHKLDLELLKRLPDDWPPIIVAGGLNSQNVADCISKAHPFGVDVASGVESFPGMKDEQLTREFLHAARGLNP